MRYWVVGGEYSDATFRSFAPGKAEERHGPFATYAEAHQFWATRAWATVDDALVRFRIVGEKAEGGKSGEVVAAA
jgi:Domain of unknown function (DUF4170)